MKNGIYKVIVIAIAVLAFNACNKSDDTTANENLQGTYSGMFTVEYLNGDSFSRPVTVIFNENNKYQSSGNADRIPAGGSGTYEKGTTKINFSDINIWTADFDWNLILNEEYDYSINGNQLVLSANKNNIGFYKYELVKE
ncbi:hypothetical protein [Aequorivita sp. CIP111184]|uniref:hypothetical protein n=1 Tax=Aequorivita sp. CIP111184 TaxID=2211356 RepID=UPI000DBBB749|nr:hypothetical protein [Aequorivita sp. CIP111184]SRX56133.1 hypothetical protein AEQU1_03160 [Aequorivita sp. CIP111184]